MPRASDHARGPLPFALRAGFDPAAILSTFAERDHPLVEITPGETYLDDQRGR